MFILYICLPCILDNRMCLQRTHDWMKVESNVRSVVGSLADPNQSNETLDSILTALLDSSIYDGNNSSRSNSEGMSEGASKGWDTLLRSPHFEHIFKNLVINSPRSHVKLAVMLKVYGMKIETEPFPSLF